MTGLAHARRRRLRARILIGVVDESERAALRRVLESARYHVEEAADGRRVLAAVARKRPHLVLLELRLPDIDGAVVLDSLRAELDERALPIIVIGAERDGEVAAGCLGLGANDYVSKPIRPGIILARVAAQLGVYGYGAFAGALGARAAPLGGALSPPG
jgi:DNA-binding response OmpR family regulator